MKVGAAQVEISPTVPVELCGFALREHPCVGVEAPIFARAVYLEHAGEKLLMIVCDVIALDTETVLRVRRWAEQALGLEPRQVMLAATHTHSAPATVSLFSAGACSESYVQFLEEQMCRVAGAAVESAELADVVSARVSLELAIDRRDQPSAHTDPWVWGVGFKRADGSFIAAMINYAMHPVAHGHVQRQVSPDWCGAAAESVASLLRCDVATVTTGAAGNLNPPFLNEPWSAVKALGQRVAAAIAPALRTAAPQREALRVVSRSVALPLEAHDQAGVDAVADRELVKIDPSWAWRDLYRSAVQQWREKMKQEVAAGRGESVEIEIQVTKIGEVYLVAINGEIFSRFTDLLRQRTGKDLFVVAYANAAFGYVPTRQAYAEGGYEVDQAHFFYGSFRPRIGGLEMLVNHAAEIINAM
ncbi:MAG TPA: hypothetical protein VF669_10770 [Tepidisphaeraceae bacterium]|jgi:hypothetical protein